MPLQNRVDPRGTIFRSTARGAMMGNRGPAIHNEHREIVRPFNGRRWITCVLEFKGRRRTVMSPGRYTELFFLDEAVAFAAGHRPCAECRRARFNEFRRAWMASIAPERAGKLPAPEIDAELHRARIDRWGGKVTYEAPLGSLPDGVFVEIDGGCYLVWGVALRLWSPEGYRTRSGRPADLPVKVLTPKPIVECLRAGYRTDVHASAGDQIR